MESKAIIQDVKLLEELLLDWKVWRKAEARAYDFLPVKTRSGAVPT